jgi:ABC-2 type transport system permease protein
LSQCSGAIWAMIWIGLVCAVLSYVALYFKRKKVLKQG